MKQENLIIKRVVPENYEFGRIEIESPSGNPIRVYDLERTLCDILRGSGSDVQIVGQAMKRYAASKDIEKYGRIDVLVNVAGIVLANTLDTITEADIDKTIAINVKAPMFATQVAARQMKKQGHGSIIVIASTAGLMGVANRMAYSTSKGALVIMCKSIAAELAGTNVRINCICPGTVDTPSMEKRFQAMPIPLRAKRSSSHRELNGRITEFTNAAVNLVKDVAKSLDYDVDWLEKKGMVVLPESEEEMQIARQIYQEKRAAGIDVRLMDKYEVHEDEPNTAPDIPGGLEYGNGGSLNSMLFAFALGEHIKKMGGELLRFTTVTGFGFDETGAVCKVETDKGDILTQKVGAGGRRLVRQDRGDGKSLRSDHTDEGRPSGR
ncbi:MAG: SDR family NAD(P)-dependent oxidoreductase [Oscillospiraceae bacterium]